MRGGILDNEGKRRQARPVGVDMASRESSSSAGKPGGGSVVGFIAALIGALVCFVGCAVEVSALGRPHKLATAVLAIVAAAFAVGSFVLVRVAIHLEHGFRGAGPTAPARVAAPATARHPKNGPVSRIVATIAAVGVLVFLVFLTVSLHSAATKSATTQHHGLARSGTVASVHSEDHSTKYDSWTTYNYDVTLSTPIGATSQTVAHDPTKDFQAYDAGEPIHVLIDPHQVSYAELPGSPVQSSSWFWGPLLFGAVLVMLAVLLTREHVKHRRLTRTS
jgi:hypothetical protein